MFERSYIQDPQQYSKGSSPTELVFVAVFKLMLVFKVSFVVSVVTGIMIKLYFN